MNELARQVVDLLYGDVPYEDHHGGEVWVKDDGGWCLMRNLVGMEWSSQFCADPKKVDRLRLTPSGCTPGSRSRTAVVYASPGTEVAAAKAKAAKQRRPLILDEDDQPSLRAFNEQYAEVFNGKVEPGDPLARTSERMAKPKRSVSAARYKIQ
jgi:hypothetical protein